MKRAAMTVVLVLAAACGGAPNGSSLVMASDPPSPARVVASGCHGTGCSLPTATATPHTTATRASRSRPTAHPHRHAQPVYQDLGTVWDRLARCEASGNWAANTGNGFYGGLQFTLSTWRAYGGVGMPHHASRATQIAVAKRVLAGQGWGAWPACSRKLGLR